MISGALENDAKTLTLKMITETLSETFLELAGWKCFCLVFYIELVHRVYYMWYYTIPVIDKIVISALVIAAYLIKWQYRFIQCCFALLLIYCVATFFGTKLSLYILFRFIVGKMVCVIVRTAWNAHKKLSHQRI